MTTLELIERHLDERYLRDVLGQLLRSPAEAPLGQNFLDPQDPAVARYVHETIEPHLRTLGVEDVLHDGDHNIAGVIGAGHGPTLLLMAYSTSHHGNRMDDPQSGRFEHGARYGVDDEIALGRGAPKKAALAAMLAGVKLIRDAQVRLRGTLVVAVNTEGYSSHRGSEHVFAGLRRAGRWPDFDIECISTGLRATLGNRGRQDVLVTVTGREAHSSAPHQGLNAIDGACMALQRLRGLPMPASHRTLGREQITVYKVVFSPIAPHTIPERADLRVDRRLLPGQHPEDAIEQVRRALQDLGEFQVSVEAGPMMLPSETSPSARIVRAVDSAVRHILGHPVETIYPAHTANAGYPTSQGVETVEFGPTALSFENRPTGDELAVVPTVVAAAKVYAHAALEMVGYD